MNLQHHSFCSCWQRTKYTCLSSCLREGHHAVLLNLHVTLRFYCLPDNSTKIIDSSLDALCFEPNFLIREHSSLGHHRQNSYRSCDGRPTLNRPGVVGLNNIKANDYCNVVL